MEICKAGMTAVYWSGSLIPNFQFPAFMHNPYITTATRSAFPSVWKKSKSAEQIIKINFYLFFHD